MRNSAMLVASLIFIVLISGCTATQIDKLLKASPVVNEFLQQYPDAKINTILVSKETVASQLENIQKDCGPDFEADRYYKTIISDQQSGQKLTAWISEKDYKVVCFVKEKIREHVASTSTTNTQNNFVSTTMYNISNPTTTTASSAPQFTSTTQNQTQTTTTPQTIILVNKTKQFSLNGICDPNEANLAGLYIKSLDNSSCPYIANTGSCFSASFTSTNYGATTTSIPSDCPFTCDDNDIWTKDWFNLETQKCEHLFCQNKVDYEYKNGVWCKIGNCTRVIGKDWSVISSNTSFIKYSGAWQFFGDDHRPPLDVARGGNESGFSFNFNGMSIGISFRQCGVGTKLNVIVDGGEPKIYTPIGCGITLYPGGFKITIPDGDHKVEYYVISGSVEIYKFDFHTSINETYSC